ncbi:MAG: hypothetical protein K1X89_11175 [Myxococcaceae bacterium]|nr:hypothetical protein [Myxococcaceae bacterium]
MKLALPLLLAATAALADVPSPDRRGCLVPASCTTCSDTPGDRDAGAQCALQALDAGLRLASCTETSASVSRSYYCPPGVQVTSTGGGGCSAAPAGAALFALAAGVTARRRGRA